MVERPFAEQGIAAPGKVTAVLGPTNTGKTHLALERMLGHRSGMIGFPLRLLARENYERIAREKGRANVALVTGEERIEPPGARWFVCTVEAMPIERPVEFLAVDEIQLCADPERGHVFTERLLRARGIHETMMVGAETMRPLIQLLLPSPEIITRPRLSKLSYAGPKKLTRLPRRSAVVAFSAAEVYAMADLMRRTRGGCAVVMGALSPRARNAQVALYQSGEVDFLVATDAIGMGLNMDLDHVAFARLDKFDGRGQRALGAPEIAQIAGRAGRNRADGTFGTTHELGALDPDLVQAVEEHRFDPLRRLSWRSNDLDFRSVVQLLHSLDRKPPRRELLRKMDAPDHQLLEILARQDEIRQTAQGRSAVRLLWEVCQIPDYRKTMTDSHARLAARIYGHLVTPGGRLPIDWVAGQIAALDRVDGDIDQLSVRLAHVRTWTYVAHRPDWLGDAAHWQGRAQEIEDKLSDVLHERLLQRFVDRRGALLVKRLDERGDLLAGIAGDGRVIVEGHEIGRIDGFRVSLDAPEQEGVDPRRLAQVVRRALRGEIFRRVKRLEGAADPDFTLDAAGRILWDGAVVGRLQAGRTLLQPLVEADDADLFDGGERERVRRRLTEWVEREIARHLPGLNDAAIAQLPAAARGVMFRLGEGLGTLGLDQLTDLLPGLGREGRKALGRGGVRFGRDLIWLAPGIGRAAVALRGLLWSVHHRLAPPFPAPPRGHSIRIAEDVPAGFLEACGYVRLGARALRADTAERVYDWLLTHERQGPIQAGPDLARLAAAKPGELASLLAALGFEPLPDGDAIRYVRAAPAHPPRPRPPRPRRRKDKPIAADSPFAKLAERAGKGAKA